MVARIVHPPTDMPPGERLYAVENLARPPLDVFGIDRHAHLAKKVTVG